MGDSRQRHCPLPPGQRAYPGDLLRPDWRRRGPASTPCAIVLHVNDTRRGRRPPKARSRAISLMPQIRGRLADLELAGDLRLFADDRRPGLFLAAAPEELSTCRALTEWELSRRSRCGWPRPPAYAGAADAGFHPIRWSRCPPIKAPGAAPEPPLVLGLIRQETEFDPYAVTSAGARGLMQVMTPDRPRNRPRKSPASALPPETIFSPTAITISSWA